MLAQGHLTANLTAVTSFMQVILHGLRVRTERLLAADILNGTG